jgi:hypothetical protein
MPGRIIYEPKRIIEEYFLIDDAVTGAMVPFKFRSVQDSYYDALCKDYDESSGFDGAREQILKARKEGFTSFILAVGLAIGIQDDNPSKMLEISYKDDATKQHFTRAKNFALSYFAKKLSMKWNDPELAKRIFSVYKENEMFVLAHNGFMFYVGSASTRTAERGGTVRVILFTESAHYPDTGQLKASEIIEGTGSQVAVGHGLIFEESTANGFNHYKTRWDQSMRGERAYKPRFFSWRDYYTEEQFALISSEYSDKKMLKQEYPDNPLEAFLTSGLPFFDQEAVEWYSRNIKDPLPHSSPDVIYDQMNKDLFRQFRAFKKGELILVHADTAGGGGDDNYAHFISRNNKDQVMVYQDNTTCTNMTNNLHTILEKIADVTGIKPIVSYERNNGGAFELDRLAALNRLDKYIMYKSPDYGEGDATPSRRFGITMSGTSRPGFLDNAKGIVNERIFVINDAVTVAQMSSFVKVKMNSMWKAQAEAGMHDDAVMAFVGDLAIFVDPNIEPEVLEIDYAGEAPEWVNGNGPNWGRRRP